MEGVRHVPRPGGLVLKKFLHSLQLQILLAALHLHSHCLHQPSVPNQHQTVVATSLTTHSLLQWYKDSSLTVSEYIVDRKRLLGTMSMPISAPMSDSLWFGGFPFGLDYIIILL